MITIINYDLGNFTSVKNALDKLEIPNQISSDPEVLEKSDGLILPGVGAAGEGMENLKKKKLIQLIKNEIGKGKPILGICLGMQLLMSFSEEGNTPCLDIIEGKVEKFQTTLKVPQIGWNTVEKQPGTKLLKNIPNETYFYFVHSFYCSPKDTTIKKGLTKYHETFCSVLEKDTIFGVQFHPEKSGDDGIQLLKNFANIL